MSFIQFSFVLMVLLLFFGDMATAETPGHHSDMPSNETLQLTIFDLGDVQINSTLQMNVTEVETVSKINITIYNEEHKSLSSHNASESLNPPKIVSPFTTTPSVEAALTPQQTLMEQYLKGLILDNHTRFVKLSIFSPVIFDKTYQPLEVIPTPSIVFFEGNNETVRTTESTTSSKNEVSADISSFIVSRNGEYSKEKSSTSKNLNKTRNAVVSLLNKKKELFADESRIDLNASFINELYSIVNNKFLSQYTRTELVVKVLSCYGWYVSNQFTLGGRLDVVKSVEESSASNEKKELEDLKLKVESAYYAYEASVGASSQKSSSSKNTTSYFSSNERITSTVDGAVDIASFMENVQIEENWRIIEFNHIVPTCKFLLKQHSALFAEIRRLIINNAHLQRIRNLQPNIDMSQYVNDIWDEYIHSF